MVKLPRYTAALGYGVGTVPQRAGRGDPERRVHLLVCRSDAVGKSAVSDLTGFLSA